MKIKSLILRVIASSAMVFALFSSANAQTASCGVGTEVQGDMGGGAKGKIAEIGTEDPHVGWYRIVFNWNAPNGDWYNPQQWNVKIAGTNTRCQVSANNQPVRPDNAATNQTQPSATGKLRVAADGTVLADRELLECPIEQKQVRQNSAPQPELLKKLIRCLFEKPARPGTDGAQTVDITAFQIGAVRKWRPLSDLGSGNANTNVHPVKVSWTWRTFYRTQIQVTENISIFNCYVNAVGEWQCGLGERIKDGEIKRIPVE